MVACLFGITLGFGGTYPGDGVLSVLNDVGFVGFLGGCSLVVCVKLDV